MPKSRRDKKVSLTKTDRKGLSEKQQIIEEIQTCRQKYENVFLFTVQNMRNSKLKEIRTKWKNSRFFFGKNRVMQLGLKLISDEDKPGKLEAGMELLREQMVGQCGLLFTSETKETVLDWFDSYVVDEYARSGFRATQTIKLEAGPLEEFSHAMEPHLRSLGMPTKLDRGVVTLYKEYTVCEKNKVLTPEQARILKLLGKPMAKLKIIINCCYTAKGFEVINSRNAEPKKKSKTFSTGTAEEDTDDDEDDEDSEMELDEDEANPAVHAAQHSKFQKNAAVI
ncbi:mRNA turnover protein 4 homolog [Anopheles aquasalis]|uniref:mRNA turnover protein 4 homolog n=1 Tax=Anopheles aquasalis TaxID=42839 RepID=UPI00215B3956|nr:mRNA turnover protein 4 homolog [Anopheles aquasalis]